MAPRPQPRAAALARLQARSLGYALIRCGQLFNQRAVDRVNAEAGGHLFREAHTRLLPHLQSEEGVRVTELARRLAVTKQAVHQLVAELVETGVARVDPDPRDARARRVRLTRFGLDAMCHGTEVLLELERELTPEFGRAEARALHRLLTRLLAQLGGAPGPR